MLKPPTLWAAFALFLAWTGAGSAEVIIASSNNPKALLNDTVRGVLGKEHAAVSALSKARVTRLSKEPRVSRNRTSGALRYDADFLVDLPFETGGEAWACLAEALYFEARGESVKGIFAVGEVILNRVATVPSRIPSIIS